MQNLAEQLVESQKVIQELKSVLESLGEDGYKHGTVLNVDETVTISLKDSIVEVNKPNIDIKRGDTVLTIGTGQIIRKFNTSLVGEIVPVTRVINADLLEISVQGSNLQVFRSSRIQKIDEGDFVVLDDTKKCAVGKINVPKKHHI